MGGIVRFVCFEISKNEVLAVGFLALFYLHTISAVRITSLDVPKTAWDAVKLNCKYDLENGTLYSVKWYKDDVEFFRCLADGSVQEFPLEDIKIYHTERAQTGSCFFELTALTPRSGGEYTCEVSLDWPTFQIVPKSARLRIVEPSRIVQPEFTTTEVISVYDQHFDPNEGSKYLSSPVVLFTSMLIGTFQLPVV